MWSKSLLAEYRAVVLTLYNRQRRVHKVVVFVLKDFDKFTAKRQAVFYNILDTMHGPDMQVRDSLATLVVFTVLREAIISLRGMRWAVYNVLNTMHGPDMQVPEKLHLLCHLMLKGVGTQGKTAALLFCPNDVNCMSAAGVTVAGQAAR